MHLGGSFWKYPSRPGVVTEEEVPLESKLNLLQGFQNLKRLSFRHSMNALDDDVLQFIFREMTTLEELEVSHCSRLTNTGITGTEPEVQGEERVSIRNLKGQQ